MQYLKYLYGFWLGLSLSLMGFDILTWQFWFVSIPTILLVTIKDL